MGFGRSCLLTTFITPVDQSCFKKLLFGISSTPEHFQCQMSELQADLPGVVCQMDDLLVFDKDQSDHDRDLESVLKRIQDSSLTLRPQKYKFNQTRLTFLRRIVEANDIQADPEKTLAQLSQTLHELLMKSRTWMWGPAQSNAFEAIKQKKLSKPTTLALYDCSGPTKISADTSAHGISAVLLQLHSNDWKPVAYASLSMSYRYRVQVCPNKKRSPDYHLGL